MTSASAQFWSGRRVLVTGHTGFKGAWLSLRLEALGARVTGLALAPPTSPSLFDLAQLAGRLRDLRVDLRDHEGVRAAVAEAKPEVVFHLAAQALVKPGLEAPLETLDVNFMGSVRLFDALRDQRPGAIVAITSDKVYLNRDVGHAFREQDALGGADPYSGSKSAAEMAIRIYRESFDLPLVSARAGNVVGGGDFAPDRLLPDTWRALEHGLPLVLRRPSATRPWTHVLDVAEGYLLYAEAVFAGREGLPTALNFGPAPGSTALTALETACRFAESAGRRLAWRVDPDPYPEKTSLAIDSSLARATLGWRERFPGLAAVDAAADWHGRWSAGSDPAAAADRQIEAYGALESTA